MSPQLSWLRRFKLFRPIFQQYKVSKKIIQFIFYELSSKTHAWHITVLIAVNLNSLCVITINIRGDNFFLYNVSIQVTKYFGFDCSRFRTLSKGFTHDPFIISPVFLSQKAMIRDAWFCCFSILTRVPLSHIPIHAPYYSCRNEAELMIREKSKECLEEQNLLCI